MEDLPAPSRPLHEGVPYALDPDGQVADPAVAPRDAPYTCLLCAEPVGLRRGVIRAAHFAHRPGSRCAGSGESVEHAAFKRLLAEGLAKHQRFTARLQCPACGHRQTTTYPLAPGAEVALEVPVGPYRADVAVLRRGEVVLAFEVYVTHAVGAEKAAGLDVPWLEVAENPQVLLDRQHPPRVTVRDTNLFRHRPCRACGQAAASHAEAAKERLLAHEEQLREQAARQAETRQREAAVLKALRARPEVVVEYPAFWITPFTPGLDAFRAPQRVRVLGLTFLVHPTLLPTLRLCEDARGRYELRDHALRFVGADGRVEYANDRLGVLLGELLTFRRPPHPDAEALLTRLRSLVGVETLRTHTDAQGNLWD